MLMVLPCIFNGNAGGGGGVGGLSTGKLVGGWGDA